MANNGRDYELFVRSLYEALMQSESVGGQHNITIEPNKKLTDRHGNVREFDLYWEYELAGVTYKTIVECKDYSRPVSVDKIDALIGKLIDFPDIKPLFATKIGYQSGAESKAKTSNIDLLVIREQNDTDWFDEDGSPLIKEIVQNIHVISPARITGFQPFLDGHWMEANGFAQDDFNPNFNVPTDQIFIDDLKQGERYSLHDLQGKLNPLDNASHGSFSKEEKLEDAYIEYNDKRYKLHSFRVSYDIAPPISMTSTLDFGDHLIGVIEYLEKGTKKRIFKDPR